MQRLSRWDQMELSMQLSMDTFVSLLTTPFNILLCSFFSDKPSPLLAVRKNDFSIKWCVGAGTYHLFSLLYFSEGEDPWEPPTNKDEWNKKIVKCVGVDRDSGVVFAYFEDEKELKKVFPS